MLRRKSVDLQKYNVTGVYVLRELSSAHSTLNRLDPERLLL